MAGLKRLDVLIRQNSTISVDDAIIWTKKWLDRRQEDPKNKENGKYKNDFFADLFDSRTNFSWKIFSSVATENRDIKNSWITLDGREVPGVIEVLSDKTIKSLLKMKEDVPQYKIEEFFVKENPFIYNGNYKMILAETDNERAEVRVNGNEITIYDASGFVEYKKLLDVKKYPTKIKLFILN